MELKIYKPKQIMYTFGGSSPYKLGEVVEIKYADNITFKYVVHEIQFADLDKIDVTLLDYDIWINEFAGLRDVKLEEVGELLNKIYESEINITIIRWFWDGGIEYNIGDHPVVITNDNNIVSIANLIRDDILSKKLSDEFKEYCFKKYSKNPK